MQTKKIFDLIGIGIGPFNLGFAALAAGVPELQCLFLDAADQFDWHPGLMIPGARLQVPFLADLVTLVDPSSPFSYLCFLKATNQLTRFAIRENYYPLRKEYNQYCQWVAAQLPGLCFGHRCTSIKKEGELFEVSVKNKTGGMALFRTKQLLIGTGTQPSLPACATNLGGTQVFHSSEYVFRKPQLSKNKRIAIIGSGQSAAEIFRDLMDTDNGLCWFTRSARFLPMEYGKLSLEMSSPDYINYFYGLSKEKKNKVLKGQQLLFRGINISLIDEIYDRLYDKRYDGHTEIPMLFSSCELRSLEQDGAVCRMGFHHKDTGTDFIQFADIVILATGYHNSRPPFLLQLDLDYDHPRANYSIDEQNKVFVQNNDLLTHGFNSADLGLGPYRNAVILNTILGRTHFVVENNTSFQSFGMPLSKNSQSGRP